MRFTLWVQKHISFILMEYAEKSNDHIIMDNAITIYDCMCEIKRRIAR